jgi:hypothetical protein
LQCAVADFGMNTAHKEFVTRHKMNGWWSR